MGTDMEPTNTPRCQRSWRKSVCSGISQTGSARGQAGMWHETGTAGAGCRCHHGGVSLHVLMPWTFLNEAALAQKAAGQGEWTVLSSTSRTWFCQTGKRTDGPQPAGRACPQGPTAPPHAHPLRPGFSRDCAMRRGMGSERTLHRLGIKTI